MNHETDLVIVGAGPVGLMCAYLAERCGLSTTRKLPGAAFGEHIDAFWTWDRWIREGKLTVPFEVAHVDAHADLGLRDSSWVYLLTELLGLPPTERNHPRTGSDALNSGSYLAYALANRWIASAKYVHPTIPSSLVSKDDPNDMSMEAFVRRFSPTLDEEHEDDGCPDDIMTVYFRDEDPKSRVIELRHFSREQRQEMIYGSKNLRPVHREPPVPFDFVAGDAFSENGFTHIVVAQSPDFLPESADLLMEICKEYFDPA